MSHTRRRIEDLARTLEAMTSTSQGPPESLFGRLQPDGPRCRIWETPGALERYKAHVYRGSFGFHSVGCPMTDQGPPLPGSGQEYKETPCKVCPHWK